jgi:hypothetical protein
VCSSANTKLIVSSTIFSQDHQDPKHTPGEVIESVRLHTKYKGKEKVIPIDD